MIDRVFYVLIAGFVGGVFLRSFVDFGVGFAWLFMLLGGVVLCCLPLLVSPSQEEEKKAVVLCAAAFFLTVGLGILRFDFADKTEAKTALASLVGQSVTLEGIVVDEPDERESVTRLVLLAEISQGRTLGAEKGSNFKTKILLTTDREPRYAYGDRLRVMGKLERPKNFQDETTLREVDYRSHHAKDGIYYEMFRPTITLIAHDEGNPVVAKLFAFKNAFIATVNKLIPQPHAALLGGLVVGAKQSLGKKLLEDFRTVGVIHIVVLSGYNITIIARFIEWLFSALSRNKRLVLASAAMILFAIMVGAGATVVRATIMALLVVVAKTTGRLYAVTRALLIAGVIMLLHNPQILVFDVSFQLSFLATVGLIYVSPLVEPRVRWITERWKLREIFVATVATQVFVLPFLMYKTGLFSVVSLPVNLLILAAIPLTMLFGFLAGMVGLFSTLLAFPFASIAYGFLTYELTIVERFAKLPFASVSVPYFPLWLLILWYATYAMLYVLWRKKQSTVAFQENLLS